MAWTGDKVAKMELVDVNGQKSSPERQDDDGMTSSTAMGLDLSVSVYRIAILRALKSGIPAKIPYLHQDIVTTFYGVKPFLLFIVDVAGRSAAQHVAILHDEYRTLWFRG
jgi:hypothetical protein